MNQELNQGKEKFDKIPANSNAISQYFMLYEMSGDLEDLVDFDYEHALITARISSNSTREISQTVDSVNNYIEEQEDSPFTVVGGSADLMAGLVEAVIEGQITSLLLAIVAITLILTFLFRSVKVGAVAALPLILAMFNLFGLMGHFNIELNMVTAILSSIMVGVGIDYTIHFLWRFREERKKVNSVQAVQNTLTTTGRGIVFNAFSVIIGFGVLLISNFLPVQFFGFLVVVSIGSCLLGALVLLPAICLALDLKFTEQTQNNLGGE